MVSIGQRLLNPVARRGTLDYKYKEDSVDFKRDVKCHEFQDEAVMATLYTSELLLKGTTTNNAVNNAKSRFCVTSGTAIK